MRRQRTAIFYVFLLFVVFATLSAIGQETTPPIDTPTDAFTETPTLFFSTDTPAPELPTVTPENTVNSEILIPREITPASVQSPVFIDPGFLSTSFPVATESIVQPFIEPLETPLPTPTLPVDGLFQAPLEMAQEMSPDSYIGEAYAILAPQDVNTLHILAGTAGCNRPLPYEIYLLPGVYTVTSRVMFDCNTRIYGRGIDQTFWELDANAPAGTTGGIFNVSGNVTLDLHNVTLRNGRAENGGAGIVWSNARLNVYDSRFINNVVPEGAGALYIAKDGFLFTRRTEFLYNSAKVGGAIFSFRWNDVPAQLQLDSECTLFQGNISTSTTPGGHGGAIASQHAFGVVTNSSFISNVANTAMIAALPLTTPLSIATTTGQILFSYCLGMSRVGLQTSAMQIFSTRIFQAPPVPQVLLCLCQRRCGWAGCR